MDNFHGEWAPYANSDKLQIMHPHLLHNGQIRGTADKLLSPGQVGYMNGWGVFSTIRVCDGVLFAYPRHYARMQYDAWRMRVPFPYSASELEAQLESLVKANNAHNATLRVALVRNHGGLFEGTQIDRDCDLIAFTADIAHWGEGVRLTYVPNGRLGTSPYAGAKITSWVENLVWNEGAREKGFDEVVLLNEKGEVSECTSANIFAVFGTRVVTPPLATAGCLPGVTRALLLEEIRLPGMTFEEAVLTPAEIEKSDASFITSTTRDLLPILEIDHTRMPQNLPLISQITGAFQQYRANYVAANKAVLAPA
jgi:branched-chain amino acid aminotransferase